jgi:hypothetical protein
MSPLIYMAITFALVALACWLTGLRRARLQRIWDDAGEPVEMDLDPNPSVVLPPHE